MYDSIYDGAKPRKCDVLNVKMNYNSGLFHWGTMAQMSYFHSEHLLKFFLL